jgi:signal transduction histidine kinase
MRALIFELRPESLQREGLVAALTRQTAALRARYDMTVETNFCSEPEIPLPTKEALYRIAQEAMQNAVKYARSPLVKIDLSIDGEFLILDIRDQGIGFDPQGSYPGHLGLHSMRERAVNAGGALEIHSAPGDGTHISAKIPFTSPTALKMIASESNQSN